MAERNEPRQRASPGATVPAVAASPVAASPVAASAAPTSAAPTSAAPTWAAPTSAAPTSAVAASAAAASASTASAAPSAAALERRNDGRVRAVIDAVAPMIDGGRFVAKRIAGERVSVEAHCFTDGHDQLRVVLAWRPSNAAEAYEVEMRPLGNDVWTAEFTPPAPGRYRCTVTAWVDHFDSWRKELERREELGDIRVALQVGSALVSETAARAGDADAQALRADAQALRADAQALKDWAALLLESASPESSADAPSLKAIALDPERARLMQRHSDRSLANSTALEIFADRKRAGFSSWYELFPRSASSQPGRHGNFKDVEARLPYIAGMGFDVVYFPPIHPIGRVNRKGANNAIKAKPGDVGSPWAIGSAEGGHKEILRELGTLEDFRHLVAAARELGMEIALDIAFQCAPDHPYVRAHPEWFKHRPDGSVQYAENPPKKYQDIYPFDFETRDFRSLWAELKSIVDFWIEQGVRIFRVDNPHTKPFPFWEWLIGEIQRTSPDVLFLAEAFTRPKVMYRLAKLGFTQSYTYFTWRNSKRELTEYFTELSTGPARQYFRPNVWPNTPDILHETLQSGVRAAYAARLVLAATLSANYGIYGPPFELMESTPREPGSEEYLDSEKYQLRYWSLDRPDSLRSLIARMNSIRRDNAALQSDASLRFCTLDNEELIGYLKSDESSDNVIIVVVNLDPYHVQAGWIELDLSALGLDDSTPYQVHDLLSDQRYQWRGRRNYVMLDPGRLPTHVFKLRRYLRTEHDFDYFL
jgi:starch synthase (maltosyl-transferring)